MLLLLPNYPEVHGKGSEQEYESRQACLQQFPDGLPLLSPLEMIGVVASEAEHPRCGRVLRAV